MIPKFFFYLFLPVRALVWVPLMVVGIIFVPFIWKTEWRDVTKSLFVWEEQHDTHQ